MTLRASTPVVLVLVAVAFLGLVSLGVWQLLRYGEKQDLEAERNAAIAAAPLDAADALALEPTDLDYRRVTLAGTWDNEHTAVIANRVRYGTLGEEAVTPLILHDGTGVLVNRGWFPLEERDTVLAQLANQPTGAVEGLARLFPARGARLTPSGAWTRFDAASIAATMPYPVAAWHVVAGEMLDNPLTPTGRLPETGYEAFDDTVPHLEYALTWFGLAGTLVAVAAVRVWRGQRVEPSARAEPGPSETQGTRA